MHDETDFLQRSAHQGLHRRWQRRMRGAERKRQPLQSLVSDVDRTYPGSLPMDRLVRTHPPLSSGRCEVAGAPGHAHPDLSQNHYQAGQELVWIKRPGGALVFSTLKYCPQNRLSGAKNGMKLSAGRRLFPSPALTFSMDSNWFKAGSHGGSCKKQGGL